MRISHAVKRRFWSKVDKTSSPHGCWLWTGTQSGPREKYGVFWDGKKMRKAHRFAWRLRFGKYPKKFVCHDCPGGDNRLCVRITHLWIGWYKPNSEDMCAKNRQAKGEFNGRSKLTSAQIPAIFKDRALGMSGLKLAKKYGVSDVMIYDILNGKFWRHIK